MMLGDGERWRSQMLDIDATFTQAVVRVWDRCRVRFTSDCHEDDISKQLVLLLLRQREGAVPFRIIYQPSDVAADAQGNAVITGRYDIRLDFAMNDDASLVYECKRLNVIKDGKKSGLATEYVVDGMMRFVCCQYSPRVSQGGMLGYVMDGALADSSTRVEKAVADHADVLKLQGQPNPLPPVGCGNRFVTRHLRPRCASPFYIHHLLLPL